MPGALPTTRPATSSGLGLVVEKLDPVVGHLNRKELHTLVGRLVGPLEDESRPALRISEYHPVAAVARPERLLPLDPRAGHLPTRRGRHPHRVASSPKLDHSMWRDPCSERTNHGPSVNSGSLARFSCSGGSTPSGNHSGLLHGAADALNSRIGSPAADFRSVDSRRAYVSPSAMPGSPPGTPSAPRL